MAGARKTIGKKTRFEVLKRDGFRCVYCGRSAPDVRLEIDHIVPVVEGGGNEPSNLVTACEDCNSGKGARPLGAAERMARLPAVLQPIRVWKNSAGDLYLPRSMDRGFPESMDARERMALVVHLWDRAPDGVPFRFGGATVVLNPGSPPREMWADPAAGVL